MDAIDALRNRRSVRVYDPGRPVSREQVEAIVDCARLAASARNTQPWEFIVVTDAGVRETLSKLAVNGSFILQAPVCVAIFCRESDYYLEDGCAATQNLLVAAKALGLGTCWVAGDKKPYSRAVADLLGAPPDQKLISLIAVGYAVSVPSPAKRPLEEVLHWEKF